MLATRRSRALALGATLVLAAPAGAQDTRTAAADSILRAAMEHAKLGDTSRAIRELERANKIAPNFAPAYYQRGVFLIRTSRLGMSDLLRRREATKAINRAIDLDRRNPFYLIELGRIRLKTPFLRLDAERLFNRALAAARESGNPHILADVQWELGQIHERRYITTANRRIFTGATNHFDADAAVSDWHYTPDVLASQTQAIPDAGELDFRRAEDFYRSALQADPAHVGAALGLLGLLADARRYEEMVRIARDAAAAQPREPRLRLALGMALYATGRDADAQVAFDTALALLPADERRDMFGLETVLRREAAANYAHLADSARSQMDSLYWDVADPLKLTRVNEARLEFLARVAEADLRFSSAEFDARGWKTDRGITLVRYGPPPVIASFAPETQELDDSDAMGRVTTVWWYPESKLRFVFVGPPAMNYSFFAGDFRAYAENARYITPVRFDNLAPRLRVDSVPVQIARFRGENPTMVDVAMYADIPSAKMLRDVDVAQTTLETGMFLSTGDRNVIASARDSMVVRFRERDAYASRSWTRTLSPGEYLYRIEARESGSGRGARGLSAFSAPAFVPGAFALSDILVARRLAPRTPGGDVHARSDLLIVPNAALTFAPKDTVWLYWEAYGLTRDSTGSGRMQVELALRVNELDRGREISARILGGLADAVGLSAEGEDRVALRFERTVALDSRDRVANFLALDLGTAPFGTYTLTLTVRDLVSGRIATQERVMTVPRP